MWKCNSKFPITTGWPEILNSTVIKTIKFSFLNTLPFINRYGVDYTNQQLAIFKIKVTSRLPSKESINAQQQIKDKNWTGCCTVNNYNVVWAWTILFQLKDSNQLELHLWVHHGLVVSRSTQQPGGLPFKPWHGQKINFQPPLLYLVLDALSHGFKECKGHGR